MKMTGWMLLAGLVAGTAVAHEGHKETGVFEPPHGGAFAKMAGHYAEVYLAEGKLHFCFVEPDGHPAGDKHIPKNIVLTVTPKGGKTVTLKAATAGEDSCTAWEFSTKAKRLTVKIKAVIAGKSASAKVVYELSAQARDGGTGGHAKAMYACPMHPEVTADKPGTCSKCGMDLVLKK